MKKLRLGYYYFFKKKPMEILLATRKGFGKEAQSLVFPCISYKDVWHEEWIPWTFGVNGTHLNSTWYFAQTQQNKDDLGI